MNENGRYVSLLYSEGQDSILPVLQHNWNPLQQNGNDQQKKASGYAALCHKNTISTQEYMAACKDPSPRALDGELTLTSEILIALNLPGLNQKEATLREQLKLIKSNSKMSPRYDACGELYGVGAQGHCQLSFLTRNNSHLEARLQYDDDAQEIGEPTRINQYLALAADLFHPTADLPKPSAVTLHCFTEEKIPGNPTRRIYLTQDIDLTGDVYGMMR